MIEVRQLSKDFGARQAVTDLAFTAQSGLVTGFLGPNGAGKTTTMRMILGLSRPDRGEVLIDGRRLADIPRPSAAIGGLIDASWLHPSRSARDHLRWLAAYGGLSSARADECLELVGLASVGRRRAGGFSLGMKQRLGLAGALLADPQALVLDEPLNGLDPEGIAWTKELLRYLTGRGKTILLSSHLLSEVSSVIDHVIVLGRGRLLADAPAHEFLASAGHGRIRVRSPQLAALRDVLYSAELEVGNDTDDLGRPVLVVENSSTDDVGALAAQAQLPLSELTAADASLEEAFMTLTGEDAEFTAMPASTASAKGSR